MRQFRIEEATISNIHAAYRTGKLTARELVHAYLQRIDAYDKKGPAINSIVNVNQRALQTADELDQALADSGKLSGPLHGIPVLVKDCIETTDVKTTFGSIAFKEYTPECDATVVSKLRDAGAIILAKTTLPDFATSWWAYSSVSGETRNPYALDRDPGGSSSGSGAAVAANFGAVGLGEDCSGSVRVPASHCCLVGVRTTPGLVSRKGMSLAVSFQDTIGPMTRTVWDAAEVLDALVGYDSGDPLTAAYVIARAPKSYTECLRFDGLRGARLGLVTNALGPSDDNLTAAVNDVIAAAVDAIRGAGAEVAEVQIPDLAHHLEMTSLDEICSKGDLNAFLAERPKAPVRTVQEIYESKQYHPMLVDAFEMLAAEPSRPEDNPEYYQRLAAREVFTRTVVNLLGANRLDALIYPDVQVPAPTREMVNTQRWTTLTFPTNTLIASQAWMPAISVPAGFTENKLPVGLEFVTMPYDEPTMLRLAYAFEQATLHRRPPESTPEL